MGIVTRQDVNAVQGTLSGWITAEVDVPELGKGAIAFVRELSSAEKEHVSFAVLGKDGNVDYRLLKGMGDQVVAYGWIDEKGKRLYSNKETKIVGAMQGTLTDRLGDKIRELSGLASEDVHDDITCPHCNETFDANLTQLLKDASEKAEPGKN